MERLLETHQDAKDEASDAEPMETDATPDSVMTSEESSTANSEKTKPGAVEDGSDPKDDPISIVVERQLRLAAASTEEQYLKLANSLAELMHYDWPLAHAVWKKVSHASSPCACTNFRFSCSSLFGRNCPATNAMNSER